MGVSTLIEFPQLTIGIFLIKKYRKYSCDRVKAQLTGSEMIAQRLTGLRPALWAPRSGSGAKSSLDPFLAPWPEELQNGLFVILSLVFFGSLTKKSGR